MKLGWYKTTLAVVGLAHVPGILQKFGHATEEDYLQVGGSEEIPRFDYRAKDVKKAVLTNSSKYNKKGVDVQIYATSQPLLGVLTEGFTKDEDPALIEECNRLLRTQLEFAHYDLAQGNIEGYTVIIDKDLVPKEYEDLFKKMHELENGHLKAAEVVQKLEVLLDHPKYATQKNRPTRAAGFVQQLNKLTQDRGHQLTQTQLPIQPERIREETWIVHTLHQILCQQLHSLEARHRKQQSDINELEEKRARLQSKIDEERQASVQQGSVQTRTANPKKPKKKQKKKKGNYRPGTR